MGRLRPELLERTERFSHRVLDLVDALAAQRRPTRIQDQLAGCGTSVGANMFEADEAMSRADFCKTVAIVIKELNECRFWLRLIAQRVWLPEPRVSPLLGEATELKLVLGTILSRSRVKRPAIG